MGRVSARVQNLFKTVLSFFLGKEPTAFAFELDTETVENVTKLLLTLLSCGT